MNCWMWDLFHFLLYKEHQLTDMIRSKAEFEAGCFVKLGQGFGTSELQGVDIVPDSLFLIFLELLPESDGAQLCDTIFNVIKWHFKEVQLTLPGIVAVFLQS